MVQIKKPFDNPMMETIGTVLMLMLIGLSNAGGLSGAGSNIPIMLIFFDMDMHEAVPISAFVAVCATVFRFAFNFNKRHPTRKERNAINYEIVQLTMPCVFMGSFMGVLLGKIIGETWQMIVFGITVAWSIKTTSKKAFQLLEEERKNSTDSGSKETDSLMEQATPSDAPIEDVCKEMQEIKYQEDKHFTLQRCIFILANFSILFVT